jgi:hypothetical protein
VNRFGQDNPSSEDHPALRDRVEHGGMGAGLLGGRGSCLVVVLSGNGAASILQSLLAAPFPRAAVLVGNPFGGGAIR